MKLQFFHDKKLIEDIDISNVEFIKLSSITKSNNNYKELIISQKITDDNKLLFINLYKNLKKNSYDFVQFMNGNNYAKVNINKIGMQFSGNYSSLTFYEEVK